MDGFFRNIVWADIGQATLDTLLMLGGSLLLTLLLGIPLGVLLFLEDVKRFMASRYKGAVLPAF